jgi:hypothetical protein
VTETRPGSDNIATLTPAVRAGKQDEIYQVKKSA